MTRKWLAVFVQVLAALYALYGIFPIVVSTMLAEDPAWFQAVLALAGLSTIACGVLGFWFAARWRRRLTSPGSNSGRATASRLGS